MTATITNALRPTQLATLLAATIPMHEPVLITGAPAIGKSEIVKASAREAGAKIIFMHPVISDPTDFKGLPFKLEDGADFLPIGDLRKLIAADSLTVCFMDDLGQAPESVQAAAMQLILERRIGQHEVSPHVVFIAATNRRADRAGVRGLIEPLKSRFMTIVELVVDLDDWRAWALKSGQIQQEVIAYLNMKPHYLSDFKPTADMVNSPSPRTWHAVSRQLALNLPPEILGVTVKGAVGHDVGQEFVSFLRVWREMVNPQTVLMAPDTAPIPSNTSALFALVSAIAMHVTDVSMGAYGRYLNRLMAAAKNEFVAISMRTLSSRPDATQLSNTRAYIELAAGPVGQLLLGGRTQ